MRNYISNIGGLSVYYPFNETSGNALNLAPSTIGTLDGTVTGATQGASGAVGNAYSFGGDGDRVAVTGFTPTTTFSFAFAMKRNGTQDTNDRVIDQASGGPTRGWHVGFDASQNLEFNSWNNGGVSQSLDYGTIGDNTWVVVGASMNGSSTKLYLNGVEVNSGGGNNFGSGVIANLQFAARSGGSSNPFNGSIQHFIASTNTLWSAETHAQFSLFFLT